MESCKPNSDTGLGVLASASVARHISGDTVHKLLENRFPLAIWHQDGEICEFHYHCLVVREVPCEGLRVVVHQFHGDSFDVCLSYVSHGRVAG